MKAARLIVLGIALSAGGLAALLAGRLGQNAPPAAPQAQLETVEILVASNDIGAGQTLTPQNMSWQMWPATTSGPQFIQKKNKPDAFNDFSGAIVRTAFASGEPIREGKIIKSGSGYVAALLPPGMRAVSMEISPEAGAGGFILPNDHVDVILTRQEESFTAVTILVDVRVLAIDQTVEEKNGQRVIVGKTATLAISPRQTETLALARRLGSLSLALRGLRDPDQPSANGADSVAANRQSISIVRSGRSTSMLVPTLQFIPPVAEFTPPAAEFTPPVAEPLTQALVPQRAGADRKAKARHRGKSKSAPSSNRTAAPSQIGKISVKPRFISAAMNSVANKPNGNSILDSLNESKEGSPIFSLRPPPEVPKE